jgi:hypothetical protein
MDPVPERPSRRTRALLLVACGLALGAFLAAGYGRHGRLGAGLQMLAPVCLVLGLGGLVRPGVIGRDEELGPGDRPIQIALAVVGVLLGGALVWSLA